MENEPLQIVGVDRIDGDRVVVGLSDGTDAHITLEQILILAPAESRHSDSELDSFDL